MHRIAICFARYGFDEIKKMIAEVDKNNDGVLSLAEFKDAMKEIKKFMFFAIKP